MISHERSMELARKANVSTDWHPASNKIEYLVKLAYAEGQKDLGEVTYEVWTCIDDHSYEGLYSWEAYSKDVYETYEQGCRRRIVVLED